MKGHIQFITTPTADTRGTVMLLHFDSRRYMIGNIHEGLQRACVQMGSRLGKVGEIFMTGRTEWSNLGGLVGMILTLADSAATSAVARAEEREKSMKRKAQREKANGDISQGGGGDSGPIKMEWLEEMGSLTLFGPPNLNHLLATTRKFVFRKGLPLEAVDLEDRKRNESEDKWAPTWSDDNIKVWAMSILPQARSTEQTAELGATRPRKRSFDEIDTTDVKGMTEEQVRDQNLQVTKGVVSDMFSSQWSLDALFETPLAEVNLPAALFIRDPETKKIERYTGPVPGSQEPLPNITVLVRKPWPGAAVKSLPPTKPAKEAVSYIFRCHTVRGKFRPDEAKRLGVQLLDFKKLTTGQTVLAEDGKTVTPDMVLEPERPGQGVAVIDLPTLEYVEPLVQREEWRSEVVTGLGAIVWLLGKRVSASQALRNFMEEFKHLQHIVSSPDHSVNRLSMDSAASETIRLSQMDPERYQIPLFNDSSSDTNSALSSSSLPSFCHVPERGEILDVMPKIGLSDSQKVPLLDIDVVKKTTSRRLTTLVNDAGKDIAVNETELHQWAEGLPSKDAEIITLGTGSALPSKYRNVSATLVRIPGYGSVLFDCGENTLGQLNRIFQPDELREVLNELRMIWISHMHADHHLGIVSVIKAWYHEVHGAEPASSLAFSSDLHSNPAKLMKDNRLAVISEGSMLQWLHEYSAVEDYGYSRLAPIAITPADPSKNIMSSLQWFAQLVPGAASSPPDDQGNQNLSSVSHTPPIPQRQYAPSLSTLVSPLVLNLRSIQCVKVSHCRGALAVSIVFPSGLKISYSGDCRPSRRFAAIGRDSHVLIHEATFDDDLKGDAHAKKHSTTQEALKVGAWMRVKATVLTHFSQRYQKVPVLDGLEEALWKEEPDMDDEVNWNQVDDEGAPLDTNAVEPASTFVSLADSRSEKKRGVDEPMVDAPDPQPAVGATSASEITSNGNSIPNPDPAASAAAARDMKIAIAFDYMRLRIGDIAKMSYFTPALRSLHTAAELEKDENVGKPVMPNSKKAGVKKKSKTKRNN